MNKDFGCEDAACKAVDALKKKWRYHDVTLHIRTQKRYDQRGRPTDASPSRTVWRFDADLIENVAYLEAERRTHGKYVVARNVKSVRNWQKAGKLSPTREASRRRNRQRGAFFR